VLLALVFTTFGGWLAHAVNASIRLPATIVCLVRMGATLN
jgi:hypothetical protein